MTSTCSHCSATIPPGSRFCPTCGTNRPAWQARFETAYAAFLPLQAQYKSGRLQEAEFRRRLEGLMVVDDAGTYWLLGAQSGRWHHHQKGVWTPADPPLQATPQRQAPPQSSRASRIGRWFTWGFAAAGLILALAVFIFVTYQVGDAMLSLAAQGIAAPADVAQSPPSDSLPSAGSDSQAPSDSSIPAAPSDESPPASPSSEFPPAAPSGESPPASPSGESPPAANTSAEPVVELLVGNALGFSDPPDFVAYANTDQQSLPPEMYIATTCQDCWRYEEWFTIAGDNTYIEATSNIPVTSIGVQFWGDSNDDWAEVLLDGEPIYQASVQGEDGNWPGGAFVRYLSISNLPLEKHSIRVRDIGKGPGGGVTLYFFGLGTTAP